MEPPRDPGLSARWRRSIRRRHAGATTTSAPADAERRWARRRVWAGVVTVGAFVVPVGVAVGASAALSRRLPAPGGAWVTIGDWSALIAFSSAVLFLVDRLTRRLLPLAALLELSLLFPDQAPRRLAVARRAGSIKNLYARIEEAKQNGVSSEPAQAAVQILELIGALHAHDRRTRGHSERVRAFTDALATELKLGPEDQDRLRWSALLHDIGKIHVPARILNKPGSLDPKEWESIHRHPEEGARLAAPLAPWLGEWSHVIAEHHERWDGSGYPHGLQGREISYGARIVALADSYEVMTAARTYKLPMSVAAARRELIRQAGTQFDPAVVRAFLEISIGRLRWITGPMSWVAQVPAVGWLRHAVDGTIGAGAPAGGVLGAAAGAAGAAVAVSGALGLPAPAAATTPPPVVHLAAPSGHGTLPTVPARMASPASGYAGWTGPGSSGSSSSAPSGSGTPAVATPQVPVPVAAPSGGGRSAPTATSSASGAGGSSSAPSSSVPLASAPVASVPIAGTSASVPVTSDPTTATATATGSGGSTPVSSDHPPFPVPRRLALGHLPKWWMHQ